jgi:3-deoxy-manno-octulosonate cytidylyltransferase (CMP-KDO synthetase)
MKGARIAAGAALSLPADIIINIQGDEPLVRPEMFEPLLASLLSDLELPCANLMTEIHTDSEFESGNVVKVVCDLAGNALYFSREPIPVRRKAGGMEFKKYKQLGIIAFRSDFLQKFTRLSATPLEQIESVDMMRAVEYGHRIRMVPCGQQVVGVDTPEDLTRASKLMEQDDLLTVYLK